MVLVILHLVLFYCKLDLQAFYLSSLEKQNTFPDKFNGAISKYIIILYAYMIITL